MVIPQLPQLSPVTLTIQRTVPLGTVTTTVQLVFSGSSRIPVLAALEKSGGGLRPGRHHAAGSACGTRGVDGDRSAIAEVVTMSHYDESQHDDSLDFNTDQT